MNIVLDTNIYLASLFIEGLCLDLVEACLGPKSEHRVFISSEIWLELQKIIQKKRLVGSAYLPRLKESLQKRAFWTQPEEKISLVKRDPSDNKILECAAACKADLIITMDKDLLKLKAFRRAGIVHPKTFFHMLPKKKV